MALYFDTTLLAAFLKAKRGDQSLRETAQALGQISPATLSRLENGVMPDDIETFLRLCDWLCMSPGEFIKDTETSEEHSMLERIEETLRSDPLLTPAQAEALIGFLKVAYTLIGAK
ncbi:MAG TPA: helix-turn-helix transcriptional regulator [Ktedonobacteraceae bacterium]|nr:helix-turn-helix transcriptional regulator [Ktedonobacteraceae bacterium]